MLFQVTLHEAAGIPPRKTRRPAEAKLFNLLASMRPRVFPRDVGVDAVNYRGAVLLQ